MALARVGSRRRIDAVRRRPVLRIEWLGSAQSSQLQVSWPMQRSALSVRLFGIGGAIGVPESQLVDNGAKTKGNIAAGHTSVHKPDSIEHRRQAKAKQELAAPGAAIGSSEQEDSLALAGRTGTTRPAVIAMPPTTGERPRHQPSDGIKRQAPVAVLRIGTVHGHPAPARMPKPSSTWAAACSLPGDQAVSAGAAGAQNVAQLGSIKQSRGEIRFDALGLAAA